MENNDLISRSELHRMLSSWDWQDLYLPIHFSDLVAEQKAVGAAPVVRGEWVYAISKGSCMDWHVTAKCSECGWDWFSKEGIGNPGHVFGAFITNGDSKPDETKAFLLENAKSNNGLRFCPNCGAKMDGDSNSD